MSLSDGKVSSAIGVSDMGKAKEFYEGKLGLSGGGETGDGGVDYECGGGTSVHVYPSPSAKPSGATLAAWEVGDIESEVDELTGNGVTFEQYDEGPMKTDEKGIISFGDGKGAFFKDPDGNVLGLAQPQ
jgi:catechol 2,3-dioxygenase-like lactoylglutathione lyase family enzyme